MTSSPAKMLPLSGGSSESIGEPARFGVLTVSDRASAGLYEDLSGPAVLNFFAEAVESPWEAVYRVVPDEQPEIEKSLIDMVGDQKGARCITSEINYRQRALSWIPVESYNSADASS
ncbi:hypothetical protein Vretimale_14056 [Volvox reticuliferus]|uniref:Uncharacterized protein n=1 Tax=Volvox reticuliferus TaxID=1737510 RepID=A0A8J4LTJ3_9CHLO|nr:hypothetical protein Vretifemale_16239 [Volvox reticuliferus]GIM10277.1 hypothetical protein Vretimale_14056 [Volvox reticuliferus]